MNQQELAALCQTTIQIVIETADFLRAELGKVEAAAIESKSLNSLVSYVDKTVRWYNQFFTSSPDVCCQCSFTTS